MEKEKVTVSAVKLTSFWVIASLFLIWNLLGVLHYLDYVNSTVSSLEAYGMTTEQAEFFLNVPSSYIAIFALGVWSGFLGAVLLLMRKTLASSVFLFSAVMVVISFVLDASAGSLSVLGNNYLGVMILTLIVALFEAWYSIRMKDSDIYYAHS